MRLRAQSMVLVFPLLLTILLLLAPVMPGPVPPIGTASAAVLPPSPTSAPVFAAPTTAPAPTSEYALPDATLPPATNQGNGRGPTTVPATPADAPAAAPTVSALLPSARPLNAPEAVAAASTTHAIPTPTIPPPSPTPSSPYRLPWPGGEAFSVVQGYSTTFTHQGVEAFAWDFTMPTGSVIEAARGGTVRYVRDDSNTGGDDVNLFGWAGNYVVIDHGDGTSGLYLHLMYHGLLVRIGQQVQQGEPIGISGGTGYATGPHLHFMVERTEPGAWYDQSVPATFADVAGNGVPVQGQNYTSGNAASPYWQSGRVVNRIELPAVGLPRPQTTAVPGLQATGTYAWPVAGPVISAATAQQPVALIGGGAGATVVAADTGTVVFAGTDGVSVTVVIDHGNGVLTVYARLVRALVLPGDIVQRGQVIGVMGQIIAGLPVHVAVALYDHGQAVDPVARFRSGLAAAPTPQLKLPNLVGMTAAQVAKAVAGLPLTVATDPPQSSATVAAGLVAIQQPAAGSLVDIRSVVHTSPSSGPPTPTPTVTPPPPTPEATTSVASVTPVSAARSTPMPVLSPAASPSSEPQPTAVASPTAAGTAIATATIRATPPTTATGPATATAPATATPRPMATSVSGHVTVSATKSR
ncbi:MAG: peptidoglycan DD-metalloendopeptidase family protein [Chloroflexota bacterium]